LLARPAELRWPTFHAVLKARFAYDRSASDISQTKSDYLKLSVPTARRMLRFWLVRGAMTPDTPTRFVRRIRWLAG